MRVNTRIPKMSEQGYISRYLTRLFIAVSDISKSDGETNTLK
jgi:hypothetical protein